ncbi:hypothetical protein QTL86_13730 [Cellulosilyticum sp. ST5]|uniref:hypothetical protein n=1 Tax=Cellulosilyticum sp. ST5 TaxID=3055805 RepID=UPI003977DE14
MNKKTKQERKEIIKVAIQKKIKNNKDKICSCLSKGNSLQASYYQDLNSQLRGLLK